MRKAVLILTVLMMTITGCGEIVWFPEPDPNAPSSVTVGAEPNSTIINSDVIITATVKKKDGAAVPDGTTVFFTTSGGELSESSATTIDGEATVILTGPSTADDVTVTATAGGISGAISVEFLPLVSVEANPPQISAINGGKSDITATVRDTDGNLIAGATVSFEAAPAGGFTITTSAVTDANGEAVATLTVAGGVLQSGTVITITAKQGSNPPGTATVTMF